MLNSTNDIQNPTKKVKNYQNQPQTHKNPLLSHQSVDHSNNTHQNSPYHSSNCSCEVQNHRNPPKINQNRNPFQSHLNLNISNTTHQNPPKNIKNSVITRVESCTPQHSTALFVLCCVLCCI